MTENKYTDDPTFNKKNIYSSQSSINLEIELPNLKLNEKLLIGPSINDTLPNDSQDRLNSSDLSQERPNDTQSDYNEENIPNTNKNNLIGNINNNNKITYQTRNSVINQRKSAIFNKFVTNIVASPFDNDSEDEEDNLASGNYEDTNKVKFNHKVSELAQYYINEDDPSSFHFSQFSETVIIHLIFLIIGPFSTPFLFYIFGRHFIINIGFYGKKIASSYLIQIFYWLTFVTTTVFTILVLHSEKTSIFNNQYVFLCPAYISHTMVLIRYITVCVKYGYFPPDYYKKLKNSRLTRTEIKSNFLLQGWIKPSQLVLDVYLKEIFQKFNIDVNKFKVQCIGSLSNSLKEDLNEVDLIINEEVRRIRQSVFRRFKKQDKFYGMIQDIIARYKIKEKVQSGKAGGKNIPVMRNDLPKITEEVCNDNDLNENEYESDNENQIEEEFNTKLVGNDVIDRNDLNNLTNSRKISQNNDEHQDHVNTPKIAVNKKVKIISPAIVRFQNFYHKKLLPSLRKKLETSKKNLHPQEEKILYKNEYVYEIKGFHLCRAILKNVFTVNFRTYSSLHKILVSILVLIPFIFTFFYYYYFNDFIKMLKEDKNSTNSSAGPSTIKSISMRFTINYISIIFLVFSFISIIPPTWLNTLNLIYGLIDITRRKRLMEITSEIINTNIKFEKRIYPLFNILHGPTLLNWYSLRTIFMSYGKRFSERILFQTSIYCMIAILSVICSFLSLFGMFKAFISMVS